jgi:hypothetical protein
VGVRGGLRHLKQVAASLRGDPELKLMSKVLFPAKALAQSEVSDAEAVRELEPLVRGNRRGAELALERTSRSIEPVNNRVHRLLKAALTGEPVETPDPKIAADVEEIAQWEALPIEDSYRRLEALVPALAPFRLEAERWLEAHPTGEWLDAFPTWRRQADAVNRLFEKPDESAPPIVRSGVARVLTLQYLTIALGDTRRGTMASSYAEIAAQPLRGIFGHE